MGDLTPFVFPETSREIRTVEIGGEPWFVAADVCREIGIVDARQTTERLDDDEYQQAVPNRYSTGVDVQGPPQRPTYVVNESGLYSLILWSTKPEAKRFKKWITSEVLPAIRKTGSYAVAKTNIDMLVETALEMQRIERQQIALAAEAERVRVELEVHTDRLQLAEARLDSVESKPGYLTVLAWCRLRGLSRTKQEMAAMGKCASTHYRERSGEEPPTALDERYGRVNMYPTELLDDLFQAA